MTATAALLGGVKFFSDHNPIPGMLARPLAANAQVGKGQFVTVSPSTGYAALNDGSVADQIAGGNGDVAELSDTSATAAAAYARLGMRWASGLADSTVANDGFTDADFGVPFWIASENTLGKLSHTGADGTLVNRSLGGLVFGKDKAQNNTSVFWTGPVAWQLARAAHFNSNVKIAGDVFALTGNTTRAETTMPRHARVHGKVVAIRVMADAGFTSSDTQYWTVLVQKRTNTTPGTPVTLTSTTFKTVSGGGTGDLTAFKYLDLALSGTDAALDFLEDDSFTITLTTAGTSAAIARLTVELIAKVG
jgi:hypothetical protein